jgi:hypothetical protein
MTDRSIPSTARVCQTPRMTLPRYRRGAHWGDTVVCVGDGPPQPGNEHRRGGDRKIATASTNADAQLIVDALNARSEAVARDLDEGRRLLYMALAAAHTDRYELVGTLVNFLCHHWDDDLDPDTVMSTLITVVNGAAQSSSDVLWVLAKLGQINEDDGPREPD